MPDVILETEQPKESFVKKYGGVIFNYKNICKQLEIAKIAEAAATTK
jgi:hypothetical protein